MIDTSSNTVVATIGGFNTPSGLAVNPAGTRVYVVNSGSNTVSVIDTSTNTVVATIAVGANPNAVVMGPASAPQPAPPPVPAPPALLLVGTGIAALGLYRLGHRHGSPARKPAAA